MFWGDFVINSSPSDQGYDKASWIVYGKFGFPNSFVFLLFFNFKEETMLVPCEFFKMAE